MLKIKKILKWTFVIAVMILIFALSSQSREESSRLSRSFSTNILWFMDSMSIENIITPIRKSAHLFIYAVLGISVFAAVSEHTEKFVNRLLVSGVICLIYGVSDELHQMFVPGRGAMMTDVLIDFAGALFGMGLCRILKRMYAKVRRKALKKLG